MKILDRYLVREFLYPFVLCLAAFVLIFVVYDLSAHLDDYIEHDIGARVVMRYYVIQMPLVMVLIVPISILLAIIYSLSTLSRHNEIVAMRASGVSLYRVMAPFFVLGIVFTCILAFLNERYAPGAYARAERLIEEEERRGEAVVEEQLAFYNPLAERAWAARWKTGSDTLEHVSVRTFQNRVLREKITAERARYLPEDGEWWFFEGAVHPYDPEGNIQGREVPFEKRTFPFEEKPGDFLSSSKESAAMNYRELRRTLAFFPPDSDIYRRKMVDLYYKLAFPFVGITIVLIAVPLAIRSTRGGAAGSVGLSIVLCILYYALGTMSLSLGRGGILPPVVAGWLPNIVFCSLGGWMLYRSR